MPEIPAQSQDTLDQRMMKLALAQARLGQGDVEPNPMVGALVVQHNRIIARGYHRRFGGPHAEIEVLKKAGRKARGAILFVTLEPCCHTGKTGPCTDVIIAAGIKRVVAAMADPNPLVGGKGFAALRQAGINVVSGVCQTEARRLNCPFIKVMTRKLPYVIAKWAQTLDGCIADRGGHSKWISGELSRSRVHEVRGRMDAIMIGIGTALADDPLLTARPAATGSIHRTALRVVLDSQCRLPLKSNLIKTHKKIPLLVVHGAARNGMAEARRKKLEKAGIALMAVKADNHGELPLLLILRQLAQRGCTNVLVEGGPRLLASLLRAGLVDEVMTFIAPKILGDALGRHAVESALRIPLSRATSLVRWEAQRSGEDLMLQGWF